jgi:hypothetical protein
MVTPTEVEVEEPPAMPRSVMGAFQALTTKGNTVVLVRLRAQEGGPFHHVVAMIEEDGSATPLAVIPAGRSMHDFLCAMDRLGPMTDPDFRGVTM